MQVRLFGVRNVLQENFNKQIHDEDVENKLKS